MNTQNNSLSENKQKNLSSSMTTGIVLIAVGISWLLFRLIDQPNLFPLFLGAGFLIAGSLTRKPGLIIPGGIVGGVGLGILAVENNLFGSLNEPAEGAAFLIAFSLGWFSIPLFSRLFCRQTEWWAFIPGSIIALVGVLILGGETGLQILQWIGNYWPVSLIIIGGYVLIKYFRQK